MSSPSSTPSTSPTSKSFPVLIAQWQIDDKDWTCRHCSAVYRIHNSTRARAHFDDTDTSLITCKSAGQAILNAVAREYTHYIERLSVAKSRRVRPNPEDENELRATRRSDHFERELLSFMVTANVAFRAADNIHLRNIWQHAFGDHTPTRAMLSGTLLDAVSADCDSLAHVAFSTVQHRYGCTIASDGWSTRTSINFINFILVSCGLEVFHSCQYDGDFKKARAIADETIAVIEQIGSENVVQVCMDGAARHSFKFLKQRFPTMFFTW
jgi:hypothetical protein